MLTSLYDSSIYQLRTPILLYHGSWAEPLYRTRFMPCPCLKELVNVFIGKSSCDWYNSAIVWARLKQKLAERAWNGIRNHRFENAEFPDFLQRKDIGCTHPRKYTDCVLVDVETIEFTGPMRETAAYCDILKYNSTYGEAKHCNIHLPCF